MVSLSVFIRQLLKRTLVDLAGGASNSIDNCPGKESKHLVHCQPG